VKILQLKNNLNTIGETISFLQEFVQVKVNNVLYIINLASKDCKSKQVNDVTNPIATTIWDKLSA
jgi:fibronectin type 3 domain-containing protein